MTISLLSAPAPGWEPSGDIVTVYDDVTYDAFVYVARNPVTGTLVATWRTATQHLSDPTSQSVASRSLDDGATWGARYTVQAETDVPISSVGIVAWPDGEIAISIIRNAGDRLGHLIKSTDDGLTWGPRSAAIDYGGGNPFPAGLFLADDGTADGRLYATAYDTSTNPWSANLTVSTDRGATWTPLTPLTLTDRHATEPQLVHLGDGELLCFIRSDVDVSANNASIFAARSTDYGDTWDDPVEILAEASGQPTPVLAPNGTLLLLYRDVIDRSAGWADSRDGGRTWTNHRGDFLVGGHRLFLYGGWAVIDDTKVVCVLSLEVSSSEADVYAQAWEFVTPPPPPTSVPIPAGDAADTRPGFYRYLLCSAATGEVIEELPLATNSLPRRIGTDTTTTFNLPLSDSRAGSGPGGGLWVPVTDPARVPMVLVLRNDKPAWAGIITSRRGTETLQLGAASLEAWFARRTNNPRTYRDDDQLDIARSVIGAATNVRGMRISVSTLDSGKRRDREYFADQVEDVLAELSELAELEGGFEWTMEVDYDPVTNIVTPRLEFGYPMLGTRSDQPEWRFEMGEGGAGGNLVSYDELEDCGVGRFATEVTARGKGEGDAALLSAPARDSDWENQIGLRVQMQTSYSTVSRQDTIDAHARRDLAKLHRGEKRYEAVAAGNADPVFGQYRMGDDVRLVVENTPRHPRHPDGRPGLDVHTRLLGWTLNPDDDTVVLDLEGSEAL